MKEAQEMWVWSLAWEESLEEEMAIHSSILAWKIPWTEEAGQGLRGSGYITWGLKELDTTLVTEHALRITNKSEHVVYM